MAVLKNTAGQKIAVQAYDTSVADWKAGDAANITAEITKDAGASAATNDTNPTEVDATDHPGLYVFTLTQAETNADMITISAVSSTGNVVIEPVTIYTFGANLASGSGGDSVEVTVTTTAAAAVANGSVWITSDSAGTVLVAGTLPTNSQGKITFLLDDGLTYYLWMRKDGENSINGEGFVASTGGNAFSTTTATSASLTGISMNEIRSRIQDMYPRHMPLRGLPGVIKNVVQHIHQRGKWSFNFRQAVFSTVDDYSDGTIALTNGSATVTGTDTTFTSDHAGRKMRISGVEYEVGSFTDTTHVELTQVYVGETDTGVSYVIYQDEYNLASDVKTIYRMWDTSKENELTAATQLDLRSRTLNQFSDGDTREYAEIGFSSTNLRRILLRPHPSEVVHIEYWYEVKITEVTTITSQVDLPSTLDETVVQGVYARIMQTLQKDYSIPERRLANLHYRDLLEEQWKTDRPLRDISIRFSRRDRFFPGMRIVPIPRQTRITPL